MIVCLAGTSLVEGHGGTREARVITVMRSDIIACVLEKLPHRLFAAQPRGWLVGNFKRFTIKLKIRIKRNQQPS